MFYLCFFCQDVLFEFCLSSFHYFVILQSLFLQFDDFQTTRKVEPRRPECANLYDVFRNISDDEMEHVKTMKACQDDSIGFDLSERREKY